MIRIVVAALCAYFIVVPFSAIAQETKEAPVLKATVLEGEKGPYLIGPITRADWLEFDPDIQIAYDEYEPQSDLLRALSYLEQDVTITCVLGTWCSDSRREVPRFWKLLNEMNVPGIDLIMLASSRNEAPEAEAWRLEHGVIPGYRSQFDVELVPTFIFTVEGEEIGRIIETPEVSLEADLAAMFSINPAPAWH